jgi:hypothetical protein
MESLDLVFPARLRLIFLAPCRSGKRAKFRGQHDPPLPGAGRTLPVSVVKAAMMAPLPFGAGRRLP